MPQAMLDGRTAVITGGARGIGFAVAQIFVTDARVIIGDTDGAGLAEAAQRLGVDGSPSGCGAT